MGIPGSRPTGWVEIHGQIEARVSPRDRDDRRDRECLGPRFSGSEGGGKGRGSSVKVLHVRIKFHRLAGSWMSPIPSCLRALSLSD